jgi:hypothetical protein
VSARILSAAAIGIESRAYFNLIKTATRVDEEEGYENEV